ncbi:(2Fe-2S)-binding protein [[Eubacterium] cellulosolvens]
MAEASKTRRIRIRVNGAWHSIEVDGAERLIDVLRDRLNLKGTKEGCGTGDCGACVVIVDGRAVPSCLVYAGKLDGSEITTIEGIGSPENLHPLQEAFIKAGAVQCGFCTPGMIMSAKKLLDSNPNPTRDQVREALVGNLCRCTGYGRIVAAVMMAAEKMRNRP